MIQRTTISVPVIVTERLILRGHTLDDFPSCAAMWADPLVTRYIGGRASTDEEVWGRLMRYAGHWALLAYGYWAIEERASGAFVGELGFADFRRELSPALGDDPELGWALTSAVHGKGYATEAVAAALEWGDDHFPGRRTVCLIHPDNRASLRVAEKSGYAHLRRSAYKGIPTMIFARSSGAEGGGRVPRIVDGRSVRRIPG